MVITRPVCDYQIRVGHPGRPMSFSGVVIAPVGSNRAVIVPQGRSYGSPQVVAVPPNFVRTPYDLDLRSNLPRCRNCSSRTIFNYHPKTKASSYAFGHLIPDRDIELPHLSPTYDLDLAEGTRLHQLAVMICVEPYYPSPKTIGFRNFSAQFILWGDASNHPYGWEQAHSGYYLDRPRIVGAEGSILDGDHAIAKDAEAEFFARWLPDFEEINGRLLEWAGLDPAGLDLAVPVL